MGTAVIENIQGQVRAEVITGTLTLANLGDAVDAQVITGIILYDFRFLQALEIRAKQLRRMLVFAWKPNQSAASLLDFL